MRPTFPSSRCLPPWQTNARSLSGARVVRCARWPAGAAAAPVHRGSRTPTRPRFACCSQAPWRPGALPRLLQIDVSTSTTTDRSNVPITGEGEGDDCLVPGESRLSSGATAGGTQGQGSRSPNLDTPHRDCSRWRLRPDPDRSGHLASQTSPASLSGETREPSDAASAAHACKARAARGSCDARSPRRESDVHQPEGPSVNGPFASERDASRRAAEAVRRSRERLFHCRGTLARDARKGFPTARPRGDERAVNRPGVA
jgi:hypothetical protein